ncbi:MAG: chemotaxis-specific protein-glutamate methyltransferase CheB, partial [Alphaproteobacteria bacterium]|nr:chemotaxis-specific protein-glutamate methyltransferase CheB [Alphaproteobacteria bacterium]
MMINPQNRPIAPADDGKIRVMVVDDSVVVRGLIVRTLESDPSIKIAGSVGNGQLAVERLMRHPADVVVLDIEMPVMDGLTALPKLLEVDRKLRVLMASTLTLRNAEISMKALQLGAADYIPKPTAVREISGGDEFKRSLLEKVLNLGQARLSQERRAPALSAAAPNVPSLISGPIALRRPGTIIPDILAVGSSTGGPPALLKLFAALKNKIKLPVLLTQHMPPTFTKILAQHIMKTTNWSAGEAEDGMAIEPGHVYVAPGDYHMCVEQSASGNVLRINQAAPENFCRPSVDVMLRSVAKVYGAKSLVVILTGMGSDGLAGARPIIEAGG